jgi:hypothetical protein
VAPIAGSGSPWFNARMTPMRANIVGPPRRASIALAGVCTENLNTGVVVMKSAQDGA